MEEVDLEAGKIYAVTIGIDSNVLIIEGGTRPGIHKVLGWHWNNLKINASLLNMDRVYRLICQMKHLIDIKSEKLQSYNREVLGPLAKQASQYVRERHPEIDFEFSREYRGHVFMPVIHRPREVSKYDDGTPREYFYGRRLYGGIVPTRIHRGIPFHWLPRYALIQSMP